MFKKIVVLFILFFCNLVFSQNKVETKSKKDSTKVMMETPAKILLNEDPNYVHKAVEKQPEFPGGIIAFRKKLSQVFDTSKIKESGTLKSHITFVIDKSGKISDVMATGNSKSLNSAAIQAIKSIVTLWTPAKIDNEAVNYQFRLPLTMQF